MDFGIHPSVNSTKQKRAVKPGISVCSRIIRLTSNRTKSQRKDAIPTKEEKTTTRMLWHCEKCTTIGLHLARLGCVGFSKRQTSPGNPMQRVLGQIRIIRFNQSTHVKQVSGKRKDHRLEKDKSNILISEVHTP